MTPRFPVFLAILLFGGLLLRFARPIRAQEQPATTAVRELRIDPAKTGVPFGSARLVIEPLVRSGGKDSLSAGYKVEISPFTSKSEAGRFSVTISDADLRRLAGGEAIHFTGEAASQDGINTSEVQGRATPTGQADSGDVRLQVEGKKGKLVFHATYHLTR